jgi:hypothetical protein
MKVTSNLDLQKSAQLVNALLHKAATATIDAALTVEGQIGYDITTDVIKYFDGTTVQALMRLADVLNDNTLGGGSASAVKPPSQVSVKSYVDSALSAITTGLDTYPTVFDAAAASVFPTHVAGRWYRVSTAGTVLGVALEVGDTIYPTQASPSASNASHWYVAQSNVSEASNTIFGIIKVATGTEFTTNDSGAANKALTVSVLNSFLASNPIPKTYVETVNLTNGTVGVTHNLASQSLHVTLTDAAGPILTDWTYNGNNAINVASNVAISTVKVVVTRVG